MEITVWRVGWEQDPPVAGERPQLRAAACAIIEPRRCRHEQQPHRADAERIVGPVEQQVDPRALDMPVEDQLERAVFRLAARGDDVERPVAQALPAPDSRSFGE